MKELYRTNDIMRMNLLRQALAEAGIESFEMDTHSGTLFSGIGGIMPRLMVIDEDYEQALQVVAEMELDE